MSTIQSFYDLKLNSWIVRQCESIGLRVPTPIQQNCIPQILAGKDCIGAAKTGSGKTLAFALPILQKLCEEPYGIFALVLTPTRELAYQIADQFAFVGRAMNLRHSVIVGGMDMMTQSLELARNPHIVIATPGRLADHLDSCDTFNLKKIKFLVLDEADRLLEGNFDVNLQTIFAALPTEKQTLLFSATITDTLEKVKEVAKTDVFLYEAPFEIATVAELDQFYVLCPYDVRDSYLVQTVRTFRKTNAKGSILVFTDTCMNCQMLSMMLNDIGFENMSLHSMIPQKQRLATLASFKSRTIKILIATDVASRGLDIPAVELVLNHTVPLVPKTYIHRVGRTARAGRKGTSITLVHPRDIQLLHDIEDTINTKLVEYKVDDKEVVKICTQVSVSKREAEMKLDEDDFYEKKNINKRKNLLLEGKDPDEEERLKKKSIKQQRKKAKKEHNERIQAKEALTETESNKEEMQPSEDGSYQKQKTKNRKNTFHEGKDSNEEDQFKNKSVKQQTKKAKKVREAMVQADHATAEDDSYQKKSTKKRKITFHEGKDFDEGDQFKNKSVKQQSKKAKKVREAMVKADHTTTADGDSYQKKNTKKRKITFPDRPTADSS